MTTTYKSLDFLGYPSYRVGADGTVWRHLKTCGRWRKLKPRKANKHGHLSVSLWKQGVVGYFLVHQLVLRAFVGPPPVGMICRHFPDRDPENNRVENLQWGTYEENSADARLHGTDNSGERNGAAKTTAVVVRRIRRLYATGKYRQKELAEMFGIPKENMYCIVNRHSWKHV